MNGSAVIGLYILHYGSISCFQSCRQRQGSFQGQTGQQDCGTSSSQVKQGPV